MSNFKLGKHTYPDLSSFPLANVLGPILTVEKLVKGQPIAGGVTRGIIVGVAGSINFTDYEDNVHNLFPVTAGVFPLAIKALHIGGTADDIWGYW